MNILEKNGTSKIGANGWATSNNIDYEYYVLDHRLQHVAFRMADGYSTHVLTIRVQCQDTTKGKAVAKRAIYDLFDKPRNVKLSGHRRVGGVYVLVSLDAAQN